MKLNKSSIIFYLLLIAFTTIIKILCAPRIELSGITGIMAVALFAGFTCKPKHAFLVTLVTLLASNIVLEILFQFNLFPFHGFYSSQLIEYSLMLVLTGLALGLRKFRTTGIFVGALAGPTIFFIISNFFTWLISGQLIGYTHDMKGLTDCYIAGLPFYRNSIVSTVVFLPVFIMAYHWIVKGKASLVLEK